MQKIINIFNRIFGGETNDRLIIKLSHQKKILFEIRSDQLSGNIVIGRGHDCDWSVHNIDGAMSSRHAMLTRLGKKIYLSDIDSSNGVLWKSKRIPKKRLAAGDVLILGECTLSVEKITDDHADGMPQQYFLRYSDANNRQMYYAITKKRTVIGSAQGDLLISWSQLVSNRHAEILIRPDESVWLHDLHSRNGTSVNGEKLSADNERILKDGDLIALADIELCFEANSKQNRRQRLNEIVATVAITLLLALGGYVAYMFVAPDANTKLIQARTFAAAGDFPRARQLLREAEWCRDAESRKNEIAGLLNNLSLWEGTFARWQTVKTMLEKRRWIEASQLVGSLRQDSYQTWNWNRRHSAAERQLAAEVRMILECCSQINAINKSGRIFDVDAVTESRRQLAVSLDKISNSATGRQYLDPLGEYGQTNLRLADDFIAAGQEFNSVSALLNYDLPDYPSVLSRLAGLQKNDHSAVRQKADRMYHAVAQLSKAAADLENMQRALFDMQFDWVAAAVITLPADDMIDGNNFVRQRDAVLAKEASLKKTALMLNCQIDEIARLKVDKTMLDFVFDDAILTRVLDCDSLNFPLPRRLREQPSGVYDRVAGIEFLYDYIAGLENNTFYWMPGDYPFSPQLYTATYQLEAVARFIDIVQRPENAWVIHGKLGDYINRMIVLQKLRRDAVGKLAAVADKSTGRSRLIALSMALYLQKGADNALRGNLVGEYRIYAERMRQLKKDFVNASPSEAIAIRTMIIRAGIPGDPVVQGLWKDAFNSGAQ